LRRERWKRFKVDLRHRGIGVLPLRPFPRNLDPIDPVPILRLIGLTGDYPVQAIHLAVSLYRYRRPREKFIALHSINWVNRDVSGGPDKPNLSPTDIIEVHKPPGPEIPTSCNSY
jgi:hypothetical protein